jgi:hypothetical protein
LGIVIWYEYCQAHVIPSGYSSGYSSGYYTPMHIQI